MQFVICCICNVNSLLAVEFISLIHFRARWEINGNVQVNGNQCSWITVWRSDHCTISPLCLTCSNIDYVGVASTANTGGAVNARLEKAARTNCRVENARLENAGTSSMSFSMVCRWVALSRVHCKSYFTNPRICCQVSNCHPGRVRRHRYGLQVFVPLYSQALMKCLKKIGLTNAYRNEENKQEVLQCLLALPLLPVADIESPRIQRRNSHGYRGRRRPSFETL